jgi:hypothetical protein
MYYAVVIALMFALPLGCIVWNALATPQFLLLLIGKWYVFWAVGARLFLAGLRQMAQPQYTARVILGLRSDESLLVIRELGFANLALGLPGLVSLALPAWRLPVALAGGTFYGLAGATHALQSHRNRLENVAMASDMIASAVLLLFCLSALFG